MILNNHNCERSALLIGVHLKFLQFEINLEAEKEMMIARRIEYLLN
jgi:hypothetical protein